MKEKTVLADSPQKLWKSKCDGNCSYHIFWQRARSQTM